MRIIVSRTILALVKYPKSRTRHQDFQKVWHFFSDIFYNFFSFSFSFSFFLIFFFCRLSFLELASPRFTSANQQSAFKSGVTNLKNLYSEKINSDSEETENVFYENKKSLNFWWRDTKCLLAK